MKPWKRIFLVMLVMLTILSLLLSACGPIDNSDGKSNNGKGKDKDKDKDNGKDKDKNVDADKVTICHKTGSAKNPYVQISVAGDAVQAGHATHAGDIIPAPEGGCPEKEIATDVPAN